MKRQLIITLNSLLVFVLLWLTGCGEEAPPASQPKTVSKKIAVAQDQTETPPKMPVAPKSQAAKVDTTEEMSAADKGETSKNTSDLIKESLAIASTYDPTGRFDPFEPLFQQKTEETAPTKGKRKKRAPQTPLERVALSQLKVTAIIRAPSGDRALVEDATGKGYVVKKGTYIGLNSGQVVEIDKDRILVEEEIEDIMGQVKINNAELKLQKPAGEL